MFGFIILMLWLCFALYEYRLFYSENYIIHTPNRWIPGRPETVCVELIDAVDDMQIHLILTEMWIPRSWRELPEGVENSTLTQKTVTIPVQGNTKDNSAVSIANLNGSKASASIIVALWLMQIEDG